MFVNFKPYIFSALYECLQDNGVKISLLVNTKVKGVFVPEEYVDRESHCITLNISRKAIADMQYGDRSISFKATFGGKSRDLTIPYDAMLMLFCSETGKRIMLSSMLQDFSRQLGKSLGFDPEFVLERSDGEPEAEPAKPGDNDKVEIFSQFAEAKIQSEKSAESADDDDEDSGYPGFSIVSDDAESKDNR